MRLLRYARNDCISDFLRNHQLWGESIGQDILKEKRAEYGVDILPTVSAKLVPEFGN